MQKQAVKKFDIDPGELERLASEAMAGEDLLDEAIQRVDQFAVEAIVRGRIIRLGDDHAVVDVGAKAEGRIPLSEFEDPTEVAAGAEFEVYVEDFDDESGELILSKRRADRIRGWETIVRKHKEGDVVTGVVRRKIKGGLLVEIDKVPVFLPASQVNIRRTGDIGEWIDKEIQAQIIKIDPQRMNIVVSRRKLIEEERERMKTALLEEIAEGQVRKGVVKNLAEFGVFVDLGGIDGLLHITDMSWGRVSHPSDLVKIDQELEVMVLKVDRDRERIALGLKQKTPSPWENIEGRYPIGSNHAGEVVNILSYGAFVKLEDGVEGLVHISEMSWTKRVNHPNEMVQLGDGVEVVVLDIDKEKQTISLGMKQTEVNPWTLVQEHYPPGTIIQGRVRNLTNYGAFIELQEGIDGLLHVSDMSWTRKVTHPSEVVKKGDEIRCVVLSVDQEKKRIALGLKQLEEDPWARDIPARFHIGDTVPGTVTKSTTFGVFVELEDGLEGLLHISELADHKVEKPEDVVRVGQRVEVRVIKIDPQERKIGLTLVQAHFETGEEEVEEEVTAAPPAGGGSLADQLKDVGLRVAEREASAAEGSGSEGSGSEGSGSEGSGSEGSGSEGGGEEPQGDEGRRDAPPGQEEEASGEESRPGGAE